MEKRELICIGCPLGCPLTVQMEGETIQVTGNTCRRGEEYARKEILSPTRIVTSTVPVTGGVLKRVSVKSKTDVPKDKIFLIMEEIHRAQMKAPVSIGDVIIADCGGSGVPIIATRAVERQT